jgi:DNA uptake protein ComE-like DNA-binding protein
MNPYFKQFLHFNKSQRNGILGLFAIIVMAQFAIYYTDFSIAPFKENSKEKQSWYALQSEIDSLKSEKESYVPKIYPFNPNFITDYKGYKLGMSTAEIDRLLAFRKTNKYANSAQEFQAVTKISDSLLKVISPFFKFPDWVNRKNQSSFKKFDNTSFAKKAPIVVKDLNAATQEDLMKVYGIGEAYSIRILKEKEKYGAFMSMEQLSDVWGLSPETIENLNISFKILEIPVVKKIKINTASIKELMQFPLFKYALAREIVIFRSSNGDFQNSADLTKIKGFPVDKAKIIDLYLEF